MEFSSHKRTPQLSILCKVERNYSPCLLVNMSLCNTRLRKEYKDLQRKPVENIRAAPKETNILEWHYVIEGQKGSSFEGGFYHGIVNFPQEYPYKPPSIQMLTPNGRFKVFNRRFFMLYATARRYFVFKTTVYLK